LSCKFFPNSPRRVSTRAIQIPLIGTDQRWIREDIRRRDVSVSPVIRRNGRNRDRSRGSPSKRRHLANRLVPIPLVRRAMKTSTRETGNYRTRRPVRALMRRDHGEHASIVCVTRLPDSANCRSRGPFVTRKPPDFSLSRLSTRILSQPAGSAGPANRLGPARPAEILSSRNRWGNRALPASENARRYKPVQGVRLRVVAAVN